MASKLNKPKWLKKLKKIMSSEDDSEKKKLKKTLQKLKAKSKSLKLAIDEATDEAEKELLLSQWQLLRKHRKKGLKKLKEFETLDEE